MAEPAPNPAASAASIDGLSLATVIARKGQRAALQARAAEAFRLDLPDGPRRADGPVLAALGTAPGAWLFIAETAELNWAEGLAASLEGLASVADQSDAYVGVRIQGPETQAILGRALAIDLHDAAFPVGSGAVTQAAHLGLMLWRREAEVFEVLSFRSYAESFLHWLAELGLQVR